MEIIYVCVCIHTIKLILMGLLSIKLSDPKVHKVCSSASWEVLNILLSLEADRPLQHSCLIFDSEWCNDLHTCRERKRFTFQVEIFLLKYYLKNWLIHNFFVLEFDIGFLEDIWIQERHKELQKYGANELTCILIKSISFFQAKCLLVIAVQ